MRQLPLLLCLIFMNSGLFAQPPIHDIDQNELFKKKNIKRLLIYKVTLDRKGNAKDSTLDEFCIFKYFNGNFSEQQFFDGKSKFKHRYRFQFNVDNKLEFMISESEPITGPASFFESITNTAYSYDSLGREVQVLEFNKDTTRLKIESKFYNDKSQLVMIKVKINNDPELVSRKYEYYPSGELKEEHAFTDALGAGYKYMYEYFTDQNKKAIYFENASEKRLDEEIFYNEAKQPVRSVISRADSFNPQKKFNQIIIYRYNPDSTLFEIRIGRKVQRYYYSTEN